ncbi:MAG: isochorismate synthase MenF [Halodesulfurarchaeum sp.]
MAKDATEPHTRNRPIETAVAETGPLSLQEAIDVLEPITAVWAEPRGSPVIAVGRAATVTGAGSNRFATVRRRADALFASIEQQGLPRPARPRLFGGFSFFDEESLDPPWTDFEPAGFVLPAIQVRLDRDRTWVTSLGPDPNDRLRRAIESLETARDGADTGTPPLHESTDRDRNDTGGTSDGQSREPFGLTAERSTWTERVRALRDTIRESDLQKVVLSAAYELEIEGDFDLGSTLAGLESRYPDCYRFSFVGPRADPSDPNGASFFGASPERLVEKRGEAVETEALAGTVERGADPSLDERQIERLLDDETLGREHGLVATQITDQLDTLGAEVSVGERSIRTLANVHHLRTPITASLPSTVHVLDIVASLHPTPALGGLPTEKAQETIAETETTVRGWYGAPVGWFDAEGDGTFAVGIRSALVRAGRATLFAGNGIVGGSDPETEWRELEAKFEPIREVLE